MEQEETQEEVKEEKRHTIKKENSEMKKNLLAKEDLKDHQEMEKEKALAIKENLVLEINQNLLVKEDPKDHQEMEKEKTLATKENLVLEINQNLLVKEDLILQKKTTLNQLALQIIQNTLEKKHLKVHQEMERKKALALVERRSLKVEVTDLKILPLKNIAKKELKSKTF